MLLKARTPELEQSRQNIKRLLKRAVAGETDAGSALSKARQVEAEAATPELIQSRELANSKIEQASKAEDKKGRE